MISRRYISDQDRMEGGGWGSNKKLKDRDQNIRCRFFFFLFLFGGSILSCHQIFFLATCPHCSQEDSSHLSAQKNPICRTSSWIGSKLNGYPREIKLSLTTGENKERRDKVVGSWIWSQGFL